LLRIVCQRSRLARTRVIRCVSWQPTHLASRIGLPAPSGSGGGGGPSPPSPTRSPGRGAGPAPAPPPPPPTPTARDARPPAAPRPAMPARALGGKREIPGGGFARRDLDRGGPVALTLAADPLHHVPAAGEVAERIMPLRLAYDHERQPALFVLHLHERPGDR